MRSWLSFSLFLAVTLWQPLQAHAACGNGVVEIGEQCDVIGGSICCIGCSFRPSTTLCRDAAGVCDTPENCTGASTTCPTDSFKPSTSICRESPGAVGSQAQSTRGPDNPDTTGTVSSGASSNFQFRIGGSGTLRTVTATASDSLQSFVNAINALKSSAPEYQRMSASLFNSGKQCQADAPGNNSCVSNDDCAVDVACALTYKVLLLAETRGAGYTIFIETDQTQLDFALQRFGDDDACNAAENCTGTSAACVADAFQNSAFVCRASAGSCDIEEKCPGNPSNVCPANAFVAKDTECRVSAGVCDPAEDCSGSNALCPNDARSSAVCRASAGACDPAELCDGVAVDCPVEVVGGNGTVCRAAAGICDAAETCDGTVLACPADVFVPAGTACRGDAGQCDIADVCTGSTAACPADGFEPYGTSCSDGDVCTISDNCIAGVCTADPMHCGDGVLELSCSEECDDGNNDDADGCSSICMAEQGLGCPFEPLTGCRVPIASGKSKVQILDEEKIGRLKFQWRWKKGAATTLAELGDPMTDAPAGTGYTLCMYDAVGLLAQASAPAGGLCGVEHPAPCWSASSRGFQYADPSQSVEPDGVRNIVLTAGVDGKSYVALNAGGGLFPFPSNGGFGGLADLTGIASPLKVQLQNTNGLCFEANYSAPFTRQEPGRFQARAD